MNRRILFAALVVLAGCSSASTGSGFNATGNDDAGGSSGDDDAGASDATFAGDTSLFQLSDATPATDANTIVTTTIYANTDDSLYQMDPMTKNVTLVGAFSGLSGSSNDSTVTDCAVNAAGDVYVNSESVIYRAALPTTTGGAVKLTKIASIVESSSTRFFALAFVPAGVLGSGEALVGGDGNGELWSIDPMSGATKDLGTFGSDPKVSGNIFALSGDLVFYLSNGKPTGLATIRSCKPKSSNCTTTDDYLAGIDMTALATAYTSGTPSSALNAGIYGGTTTSTGNGTGFGELYGLGAWNGDVFAFSRHTGSTSAELISIDTTTGKGSLVSSGFTFTNGWSGAGVTTSVTVTVPPPPNTPR